MVIISTSATEVSIQAVSPEFGVHFSVTAFFGSESLTQACGGGRRLRGGCVERRHAQTKAEQNSEGESQQPRTGKFLQRHGLLLSLLFAVRAAKAPPSRSRRCGCGRRGRG